MNETLVSLLTPISDTRGFMVFCLLIAVAYASIWALFLFEAQPKQKKAKSADTEEDEEQKSSAPRQKEKQAA